MDTSTTGDQSEAVFVLERDRRLSQSLIWSRMRRFYQQEGIAAWNAGAVPHYVTSNPFIATAYANVMFGWFRDCHALARSGEVDLSEPLYIVELGAGSGRFAFHFLRHLTRLHARSALKDLRFQYVMTDLAERNLAFWRDHPSLQPFVDAGVLDFALFDAADPQPMQLCHSGLVLSPGSLANPPAVIANYVFDSLPQDAFSVSEGKLYESRVTLASERQEVGIDHPDLMSCLSMYFENHPVEGEYYDDPAWNRMLEVYRQRLPKATFLVPTCALRCIRHLSELAGGRMLLLAGDKAYNREYELLGQSGPGFARHEGAFSLMVNFHAIGQYALATGGQFLCSSHHHPQFAIAAFVLGLDSAATLETRQAFEQEIAGFSPEDLFTLRRVVETQRDTMSVEEILAWIRCTRWDAVAIQILFAALSRHLDSATDALKRDVYEAVQRAWGDYYFIGEQDALITTLGMLLGQLEYYAEALTVLQQAQEAYGPEAQTHYLMAMCHYHLKEWDAARERVNQALALDPVMDDARLLRVLLETDLGQRPAEEVLAGFGGSAFRIEALEPLRA